jgi:hypothetical protein
MFRWWCFDAGKEVEVMAIAWFLTKAKSSKGWQSLDFGADQRFVSIQNNHLLDIWATKMGRALDDDQTNKKGLVEQIKRAPGLIVRWKAGRREFDQFMEHHLRDDQAEIMSLV